MYLKYTQPMFSLKKWDKSRGKERKIGKINKGKRNYNICQTR